MDGVCMWTAAQQGRAVACGATQRQAHQAPGGLTLENASSTCALCSCCCVWLLTAWQDVPRADDVPAGGAEAGMVLRSFFSTL